MNNDPSRTFTAETGAPIGDEGRSPSAGTLLLVEDEPLLRLALGEELRQAGYSLLEAADAREARGLLQMDGQVALMISDVNLPGMSGIALARWATEAAPGLKIVLISGHPDNAVEAAKFGYFLQKPFRAERLVGLVHALLEGGQRVAGMHGR